MKRLLLATIFLAASGIFLSFPVHSQISQGGLPLSYYYILPGKGEIVSVPPLSSAQIQSDIESTEKDGSFYKYGRIIPVDFSAETAGKWEETPDGSRVWRLTLQSVGALALTVHFSDFHLPSTGKLFLYNQDKKQVIGAFTQFNNSLSGIFTTELIEGEMVTIEYNEDEGTNDDVNLHITGLGYAFRSVYFKDVNDFGGSGSCEVNVNCSPEGTNWQDQKRGVVRVGVVEGSSQGWCSGSLINNTNEDCTPYILTADHCGGTASPSDFAQWTFYFDYESPSCSNPANEGSLATHTITGCSLCAHGGTGGSTGSDFLLLLLSSSVPDNFNPYYNGWSRDTIPSVNGVGIHHPAGDIKKISVYSAALISSDWNGSGLPSHWKVTWVATTNGHGVTEGGSSGSPLFNPVGQIVGQLTGGSSYCSSPQEPDFYGKFYYSWITNGTSSGAQLKPWLDPGNTNTMTLQGKNSCASGGLYANFTYSPTIIVAGNSVNFTDASTGGPTSWNWTFNGGIPATSSQHNPTGILYSTPGTYTATLVISNGLANANRVKDITVIAPGPPVADFTVNNQSVVTGHSVNVYDLTTGGPTQWTWTFVGGTPGSSNLQNPSNITYNYPGTYNVSLSVSNPYGNNYKIKVGYITVTNQPPVVNYCDTLTNMLPMDSLMILPVAPWGYIPGHNAYYANEYADRYINTLYDTISGLIVPVNLSSSTLSSAMVEFKVWGGDTVPTGVLGSKSVPILNLIPNFQNIVMFDQPVAISGNFFVGYKITYYPGDNYQGANNFAVNMAKNRGKGQFATLFLKISGQWNKLSNLALFDSTCSSLSIKPITCYYAGIHETNENNKIIIYPNPAGDVIHVNFGRSLADRSLVEVFDMIGNLLPANVQKEAENQVQLDLSSEVSGIYFIKVHVNNFVITKKVIIVK
ncbi:MAG: PKD domain-containing protein [Bacteroidia bacterium]|nr:PKD domain-containing protein [Bacteroidia bacterium]